MDRNCFGIVGLDICRFCCVCIVLVFVVVVCCDLLKWWWYLVLVVGWGFWLWGRGFCLVVVLGLFWVLGIRCLVFCWYWLVFVLVGCVGLFVCEILFLLVVVDWDGNCCVESVVFVRLYYVLCGVLAFVWFSIWNVCIVL